MQKIHPTLKFPLILAPMLGVVTAEMVATVSNCGALGMLPLGGQSADRAKALIEKTQALTSQSFGVNLFANPEPDWIDQAELTEKSRLKIEHILQQKGWADQLHFEKQFSSYTDLIDLIIEKKIPIVSFTFGVPTAEVVTRLKKAGVLLIGNVNSVEEALLLQQSGMDGLVAQGMEAGGHRAGFLPNTPKNIHTIELVQSTRQTCSLPIIAAGGIYNRETMKAAFKAGAAAVQIGTHFIPATESLASSEHRRAMQDKNLSTLFTKAFSGRWARGISNDFMKLFAEEEIPDYPIQNLLTRELRKLAKEHHDPQFQSMWAGIHAKFAAEDTTENILLKLIQEYKKINLNNL